MSLPIWKETSYKVPYSASPFSYTIVMGTGDTAQTVFNGKAWAAPQEETIDININKVAMNYLDVDLPDLNTISATTTHIHPDAYHTFFLKNSSSETLGTYDMYWDWSYDDNRVLSNPINGHMAGNMFSLKTVYNSNLETTISRSAQAGYTTGYCGNYALYYLNKFGGWDAYLIEGKVIKSESYERYSIENHKGIKSIYDNEILTKWEVNTGWLNDRQSELVFNHLLSSDKIFLHDLINDKVYEVINTETQGEYKTYKNEKGLISYQFNLESASKKKIF